MIREAICLDWLDYIEGNLAPDRADKFRAHMVGCPECQESVSDGLQLAARLSDAPVMRDVPRLARRYFEALDGFAQCDVSYSDLRTAELALRAAVFAPEPAESKWMAKVIADVRAAPPRPRGRIRRLLRWLSWD